MIFSGTLTSAFDMMKETMENIGQTKESGDTDIQPFTLSTKDWSFGVSMLLAFSHSILALCTNLLKYFASSSEILPEEDTESFLHFFGDGGTLLILKCYEVKKVDAKKESLLKVPSRWKFY